MKAYGSIQTVIGWAKCIHIFRFTRSPWLHSSPGLGFGSVAVNGEWAGALPRRSVLQLRSPVGHAHRTRRGLHEAELRVEVLRLAIGDEADVAALRHMGFDVLQDLAHDAFAQPLALVRLEHGNVDDLEKAPAITDHPPHSHGLRLMKNLHREERIGQTAHRCFIGLAAEAGARAQRLVDRDGRGFEQAGIVSQWRHRGWE